MIIYAVYVISSSGKLLIAEKFQSVKEIILDEVIAEGLSAALQASRYDPDLNKIEIKGLSYNVKSFGMYRVILVTPVLTSIEDVIQSLGLRFLKEHGELLFSAENIDEKEFSPFKKTIHEILSQETDSNGEIILKPIKKFTTAEIFNFSHQLQSIALAIAALGEGTLEEIALESGKDVDYTLKNVTALQEKGFLGKKDKSGKIIYFCSV